MPVALICMSLSLSSIESFQVHENLMFYQAPKQQADSQLLVRVAVFAFFLHVLAIYLIEIEESDSLPSSLSVTLTKALLNPEVVLVELLEEDLSIPAVDELTQSNKEVEPPAEPAFAEKESSVPPSARPLPEYKIPPLRSKSSALEYHRFSEILRAEASRVKNKIITFSTADFLSKGDEPSYFRNEAIQTLISAPRRVVWRDARGYRTILTDDGFGNIRCVQERGFVGDANPPLWYIIPAKTCGHLK
jgi:hypothetical protein